jgi:hypothetical protein
MWQLSYQQWGKRITLENPTTDDFDKVLDLLYKEFTRIYLFSDDFALVLINHYWDDRVFVCYNNYSELRTLVDPEIPEDEEWFNWRIEIWTPAESDRPIRYTVSPAMAVDVAKYVFENKTNPPNYQWSSLYGY